MTDFYFFCVKVYAGSFIYEDNGNGAELKMFNHPEGYVEPNNGSWRYVYKYTDHLGSTRLLYSDINGDNQVDASEIIEENHYYPFGLKHKGYNNVTSANVNSVATKFQYNGKEFNDELGLDWLDFHARNYDASIGRWMNLDPHSESYYSLSPYVSFANNPISFVDPDGKDITFWQLAENKKGQRYWKKVGFNDLHKDAQKALEAFAKTDEGKSFLADFARKGDKIGSVTFEEDGKYAKHELAYGDKDFFGGSSGSSKARIKKYHETKVTLEWTTNTAYKSEAEEAGINFVSRLAVVNGHEAFIHFTHYIDELITAFDSGDIAKAKKIISDRRTQARDKGGKKDHSDYINGDARFKRFKSYISQLKKVLNPTEVNKAKKEHDGLFQEYKKI